MRTRAVSATDSVHAEAELQYMMERWARARVLTQSKPAPAEEKMRVEGGRSALVNGVSKRKYVRRGFWFGSLVSVFS
jgi:hypothetical protein